MTPADRKPDRANGAPRPRTGSPESGVRSPGSGVPGPESGLRSPEFRAPSPAAVAGATPTAHPRLRTPDSGLRTSSLRRWPLVAALAVIVLTVRGGPAPALAPPGGEALLPGPRQMARIEAAVDRGLEYLLKTQKPDGSWPSGFGNNNGVNGICLLAFLGRGHAPGRGPYQGVVNRAVRFIRSTQRGDGLYASPNMSHGPMYEHALATLAMIQAYGFIPTVDMRASCQQAIDLIVKAQSPGGGTKGGWRYQPAPGQADLSVTVMQVVALRAAQNARLNVPKETMESATQYVRSCAKGGGFCYQPGGNPTMAQTAAGCLSMQLLGQFDDPTVEAGLQFLQKNDYNPGMAYFWYTNYYAMQAHFQAGGKHWEAWHPRVRDFVLQNQNQDGSWPGYEQSKQPNGPANCYSTALACMTLEVYMHYLPAYQR